MVTLLNALQPGGKCIITGDFQKELAYLQNVILYNDSSLRLDFLVITPELFNDQTIPVNLQLMNR